MARSSATVEYEKIHSSEALSVFVVDQRPSKRESKQYILASQAEMTCCMFVFYLNEH